MTTGRLKRGSSCRPYMIDTHTTTEQSYNDTKIEEPLRVSDC